MVRPNPLLKLLATSALLCLSGCQTAASSNVIENSRPATGPVAGRIHHLEGEGLVLRVSSVMFDSGNPKTIINVPKGASFDATLADNAILRFAIGPDTVYSSRVGDIGTDRIVINQDMNIRTCAGIAFFERHAMFMNYDNGMIGLR